MFQYLLVYSMHLVLHVAGSIDPGKLAKLLKKKRARLFLINGYLLENSQFYV